MKDNMAKQKLKQKSLVGIEPALGKMKGETK